MSLIPALRRQRRADLCEFEASLAYKASSRTAGTVTQRNPVLKNQNKKERKEGRKERRKEGRKCPKDVPTT